MYYRLLRLISASVQPLFVFDGPHKPTFKRNKRSGHHAGSLTNVLTKQLLKLFGFPFHIAPGEAEAECALLQREGIVDAVLSEDVDTLMFGCGITLRNWSSEGSRGNHSPTHVSLYDAQATKNGKSKLDREGMILIAMMSGGDYITEGIPGCGIKLACQAARAGFGKSLCRLSRSDTAGLEAWKSNLVHEVHTNESRYFKTKHAALKIPDTFPNKEVLGYYTHPVVSSTSKIKKLKEDIIWDGEIDIPGLRLFVAETFEWTNKTGAKKFIRGLAPALLVHKLRLRGDRRESGFGDIVLTAMNEMELVRAICGKRAHFSTDGTPEIRVIYHPADIVGLDLDAEGDDSEDYGRDGLALATGDDEIESYTSDSPSARLRALSLSKRSPSAYDPTQPEKLWILETIAKIGIPLKVEDYEESLQHAANLAAAKAAGKKPATKGGAKKGAMDKFVKVSKPTSLTTSKSLYGSSQPPSLRPNLEQTAERPVSSQPARSTRSQTSAEKVGTKAKPTGTRIRRQPPMEKPDQNTNPWSLAQSPSARGGLITTKPLSRPTKSSSATALKSRDYIDLSSSTDVSSPCHESPLPNIPRERTPPAEESNTVFPTPPKDTTIDTPPPRKKPSLELPPKATPPQLPHSSTYLLAPEPVNRKIDFQAATSRAQPPSPDLPSVQDFLPSGTLLSEAELLEDVGTANKNAAQSKNQTEREINMPHRRAETEITTITSSPPAPSPASIPPPCEPKEDPGPEKGRTAKAKKYLMLRESLPGSWKEVDESAARTGRGRAWRLSQVETLDMTAD